MQISGVFSPCSYLLLNSAFLYFDLSVQLGKNTVHFSLSGDPLPCATPEVLPQVMELGKSQRYLFFLLTSHIVLSTSNIWKQLFDIFCLVFMLFSTRKLCGYPLFNHSWKEKSLLNIFTKSFNVFILDI